MNSSSEYLKFVNDFSRVLSDLTNNKCFSNIIFLCIGTDRVQGDSFGPLVGYKLNCLYKCTENTEVIGDFNNLVCAKNIQKVIEEIKNTYKNPFIIAIDSALSKNNNTGEIIVSNKGIYISNTTIGKCIYVGDMSIRGVVGQNTCNHKCNMQILQTIPLGTIMKMADITSNGIYNVIEIE